MVRLTPALTILTSLSSTRAFIPAKTTTPPTRSLHATPPTMVIYWTIKTAIDTAMYSLGMTDSVKGTGVWNSFELKRDTEEEEEKKKEKDDSDAKK